ncbi:Aste57867_25086 [Aphanomyces stellatus]|uniref:Aste57867_25086 protein n=1 Tax=Aphanomyces stellatus TaxID=120398 RepID=A0A485LT35_9STRA|nr:hypothetical protein As57867_025008 [Aphanomyces stellatus]VFU01717.1 Aste57867_25086 [Aphanomyces stellatus]
MVAVFPFVDPNVRRKYICMRLFALRGRTRHAQGLEDALQILLDSTEKAVYDRRAAKCLVSVLAHILRAFPPPAPGHAHLHFLCHMVLRGVVRFANDIRVHAVRIGFVALWEFHLAAATAELTGQHALLRETLTILRMRLLVDDVFSINKRSSGHAPLDVAAVATIASARTFLGLPPPPPAPPASISTSSPKASPAKYVVLPANASYITLGNWKKKLKLAYALCQDGNKLNMTEAAKILRGILKLRPHGANLATIFANLGAIHLAHDELLDAIACFEESLARSPDAWKVHFNLGLALVRHGRLLEGKSHLQTCIALQPPGFDLAQRALDEVQGKWQAEAAVVAAHAAEKQAFANELSTVLAVVEHLPSLHAPILVATDHAAVAFAAAASAHCAVPVTQPLSPGWDGVVAALLHRLYVLAALKKLPLVEMFREKQRLASAADAPSHEYVTLESLDAIVVAVTGRAMTKAERDQVAALFPSGDILYPVLQPNAETLRTIQDIKANGASYNMLNHRRVVHATAGGGRHRSRLWKYMDLALYPWIKSINQGRCQVAKYGSLLAQLGLFTVMHLALAQPTLRPTDFKALDLNERGTLIFELFGLRSNVEKAAGFMVQGTATTDALMWIAKTAGMLGTGRIVLAKALRRRRREQRQCTKEDHDVSILHWTVLRDQMARDEKVRAVASIVDILLTRVVEMVSAVEPPVNKLICFPIRTELRQRTNIAAASIQQSVRHFKAAGA